ncbi:hypothetical protein HWV07_15665 [Natronomonas salina]|uniref:DUF7261 family protein n=1 Tax=Natronomonas salina TaxID=1710540 RepID=UPI0015B6D937|nr:hypothetical protein [Natronomonas salina]QLD90394.1 hypothetical protein HWV07_15665 [Natronomonas salina]
MTAAAVIAIALTPILLAYLQLGYHPDVQDDSPAVAGDEAVAFLDRSVHNATAATAGDYGWDERDRMAEAVRAAIGNDVGTLESSRLESGIVYDVSYNQTAATEWAGENCDSGPGKRFGDCETDGGVVLQERADEAVLLAVGFDVRAVGPDAETDLTLVVEVGR